VRAVDLAIYADLLAGEHAAFEARAEQARSRLREAAIERDARANLGVETVAQLEAMGVLGAVDEVKARSELRRLTKELAALEELQAWVESRLAAEQSRAEVVSRPSAA